MSEPIPGSADAVRPMLVGKVERLLTALAENLPPNSKDFSEIVASDDAVLLKIWEYNADGEREVQGDWQVTVQRVGP